MGYMHEIKKEWDKYVSSMDKVSRSLDSARVEFDKLEGVRTRKLDKTFDKIEESVTQTSLDTGNDTQVVEETIS